MISHISGKVFSKRPLYAVLDVHGVGYRVYCTESRLHEITVGDDVDFHTHMVVREDVLDLYGFKTEDEIDLFVMLIGVSGIGPRSALGIMNLESIEKLLSAISNEDVGYLTKVSGVGKKSAEKIVLELKDKVGQFDIPNMSGAIRGDEDVLEALKSLGYRADEAREALRSIPNTVTEQGEMIKEALKKLS